MRMKRLLTIGFILLLLTSMATVATAVPWDGVPDNPTPAQALWVDPKNITNLNIGNVFTVDTLINITDPAGAATGLFGFQYEIFWNITNVQIQDIQLHSPFPMPPALLIKNETGIVGAGPYTGYAYHLLSITAVAGQAAFTGVTSLCTYKFKVLRQPGEPEPDECHPLAFGYTEFTDDTATIITMTVIDGMYCLRSIPVPKPKVGVSPVSVEGVFGENFTVDIVIEGSHPLFPAKDLCGWEAKLSYNTTMLDALEVTEGAWFASFAGANGTYPIGIINDTLGIVHMADMYLGGHVKPSGAGVLMTIKFNASWMYTVPPGIPPVTCVLDLFDVLLVNCATEPLELYGVNDGEYEAPYKTLGWSLDCWTDDFRKKCETPFTGIGPNATADAYEPHDMVILYAKLTYNEWPQQNWIVTFEIYGPANPYENITIFRTAVTNAEGIATINFTIPWPCENSEEIIFGKWVCYQYAQVKDPWAGEEGSYSARPFDVLVWDVGWIIELVGVEVSPDPVSPCETLAVTVFFKNIMQISKVVVFTVTLYDTLLDPIGSVVDLYQAAPGEFCNPFYDNFTLYLHIPKWTHVGPGATVFVNAFTALPTAGGCVYCPEVSATFTIQVPP